MQSMVRKIKVWMESCILMITMFFAIVFSLLMAGGYQMYERALEAMPVEKLADKIQSQPSYTPLSQLPAIYIDAVLAAEDPRFYQHHGINFPAVGKALLQDIQAGGLIAGGSSITQQLCKNQFFTQKKQFVRKIAEVFMVRKIEQHYTKDEILALYINSIYYGNGYYTVRDASQGYFDKLPAELNDWEATMLAGIPNAPSAYAPTVNAKLALQRQRQVIKSMVAYRYLTQAEANVILEQCPEAFLKKYQ